MKTKKTVRFAISGFQGFPLVAEHNFLTLTGVRKVSPVRKVVAVLLGLLLVSKASFAWEYKFHAVNVGKQDLECWFGSAKMASGYPIGPLAGDTPFKSGEQKDYSATWDSGRFAIKFNVYKGQFLTGWQAYAQGLNVNSTIFFGFSGDTTNGTVQVWQSDPRPPLPPSNSVPVGWPHGQASSFNGLTQIPDQGAYLWDGEGFEYQNPFTDSTQEPPADFLPAGQEWKFGLRPGGPVFAPNADTPEWYSVYQNGLNPTEWVDENGLPIEGMPQDFDGDGVVDLPEANAARLDYWGRTLADLGANRNGLLTDINGNVVGLNADLSAGVDRLESSVESTSANLVQATEAVTAAIQDGAADIVQATGSGTGGGQDGAADIVQAIEQAVESIEGDGLDEDFGDGAPMPDVEDEATWGQLKAQYESWDTGLPGLVGEGFDLGLTAIFGQLPAVGKENQLIYYEVPGVAGIIPPFVVDIRADQWAGLALARSAFLLGLLIVFCFKAYKIVAWGLNN